MKRHLLIPLLACVLTPILAPIHPSAAAPAVEAAPERKVMPVPAGRREIKKIAKMTAKNAAAVPGETRNVEATLTSPNGETPIAGKPVSFRFEGKNGGGGANVVINLGSATTNAQGKATVAWKVPELGQAPYTLKASFAGDDDTAAAADEANFGIIKGITKFDATFNYGALDSHGGPHFGTLMVYLRRQSDNATLDKTFHFTVNGSPRDYTLQNGNFVSIVLPSGTNTWNVKLVFDGDAANQATMLEKTYNH
jgi:hypothetical protein